MFKLKLKTSKNVDKENGIQRKHISKNERLSCDPIALYKIKKNV